MVSAEPGMAVLSIHNTPETKNYIIFLRFEQNYFHSKRNVYLTYIIEIKVFEIKVEQLLIKRLIYTVVFQKQNCIFFNHFHYS